MNDFLGVPPSSWVGENALAFAIEDKYPVSPGHTLCITRRVVETWFEATREEQFALLDLVDETKRRLDRERSPAGYNVGFNAGRVAGQTVPHLHVHVIPRYAGDMEDPRGGVRHVIPGRGYPGQAVFRGRTLAGHPLNRDELRDGPTVHTEDSRSMNQSASTFSLRLVTSAEEIRAAISTFQVEAASSPERAHSQLRSTTYWIYDPDSETFGPGKFVGYAGMTMDRYEDAHAGRLTGDKFDGYRSRTSIEGVLGRPFTQDAGLASRLITWGESLLGQGALGGADQTKWRFVMLSSRAGL